MIDDIDKILERRAEFNKQFNQALNRNPRFRWYEIVLVSLIGTCIWVFLGVLYFALFWINGLIK